MRIPSFTACLVICAAGAVAQVPAGAVAGLEWRSIGPATTGGRIADITAAKSPGQPQIIYVGTATGGVFKSANAGISWTPVFDHAGGMMSIGAVAVVPSNPSIVWVGTGESHVNTDERTSNAPSIPHRVI